MSVQGVTALIIASTALVTALGTAIALIVHNVRSKP